MAAIMNIQFSLSHLIQQGLLNKETLEVGKSNIRISNKMYSQKLCTFLMKILCRLICSEIN